MGLVSRGGVVPLNLAADIAGAVTRTVADTAAVLQVIAGEDPNDSATVAGRGRVDVNYAAALRRDGLKGARLGVLHQAYDTPTLDKEVDGVFRGALGELRNLGAEVIDPVAVVELDALRRTQGGGCNQFKYDLNRFLGALGNKAPMHSLEEIISLDGSTRRFRHDSSRASPPRMCRARPPAARHGTHSARTYAAQCSR
jgi:Asp-tRNA(Asn)/Glu-tRNA(Gln) amidotransferase A subunit family amidase